MPAMKRRKLCGKVMKKKELNEICEEGVGMRRENEK